MRGFILVIGTAALAACGQSSNRTDQTQQATAGPKETKKKPAYCFFKNPDTKGWTAARGKDGNIVVKGKAFRLDPRYKAVLEPPVVTGNSAEIRPSVTVNDTGYAAPDNWWDLSTTIPNSAAVDRVEVRCGDKTLAELKVPASG